MLIELKLDRAGIGGIEGKSDGEVIHEWIAAAFVSAIRTPDPFTHIIADRVLERFRNAKEADAIELEPLELLFVRCVLARAGFAPDVNQLYTQLIRLFRVFE